MNMKGMPVDMQACFTKLPKSFYLELMIIGSPPCAKSPVFVAWTTSCLMLNVDYRCK